MNFDAVFLAHFVEIGHGLVRSVFCDNRMCFLELVVVIGLNEVVVLIL